MMRLMRLMKKGCDFMDEDKQLQDKQPSRDKITDIVAEEKIAKLEDDERKQLKKNKKLRHKVGIRNVIILVLIVIIIILLLRSCSGDTKDSRINKPELEYAEYIQPDDVADMEHTEGTTAIPVISDFTVRKSYPYATLFNPESNLGYSYLSYKFTDSSTGKVIYESKLVEAGKKFSVAFGDLLDIGTYQVSVDIYSYDYTDPTIQKNGGHSDIILTVTE